MFFPHLSVFLPLLAFSPSAFALPRTPPSPELLLKPPFAPYTNTSTTTSPTNISTNASSTSTSTNPFNASIPIPQPITLHIEGALTTYFSAPLLSSPRNITTPSSPTPHLCTGLANGANPHPGSTPISALDAANATAGFTYDAVFYGAPYDIYGTPREDFIVTRIGNDSQTETESWQAAINYVWVPMGEGCEVETKGGDSIIWAYGPAFKGILRLSPSGAVEMQVGETMGVGVLDMVTGAPVSHVELGGIAMTDEGGQADLRFTEVGNFTFVAAWEGYVRSEILTVIVLPI